MGWKDDEDGDSGGCGMAETTTSVSGIEYGEGKRWI